MGNKGAFITFTGKDVTPKFTTYEAVVSIYESLENQNNMNSFLFLFKATSKCETNGICK